MEFLILYSLQFHTAFPWIEGNTGNVPNSLKVEYSLPSQTCEAKSRYKFVFALVKMWEIYAP